MSWQLCFWEPYRLTSVRYMFSISFDPSFDKPWLCTDTLFLILGTNPRIAGNQPRFAWNKRIFHSSATILGLPVMWGHTFCPPNLAGSHHVKGWLPFIWYHLSCPWAWWWDETYRSPQLPIRSWFWTINSMFKSCYKRKPSKFHGVQHLPAKFQKHLHYAWAMES